MDDSIDVQTNGTSAMSLSERNMPQAPKEDIAIKVIDSIKSKGAKLVSLNVGEMATFRFSCPGLRIIPEQFYSRSHAMHRMIVGLFYKMLVGKTRIRRVAEYPAPSRQESESFYS